MALILVADDDEKVCRWLRTVLEMEGYQVIEAADGRQALRTIQSQSPDLVILDVYLPVQDGSSFSIYNTAAEVESLLVAFVKPRRC